MKIQISFHLAEEPEQQEEPQCAKCICSIPNRVDLDTGSFCGGTLGFEFSPASCVGSRS